MGTDQRYSGVPSEKMWSQAPWLELLHRELDGDLTPQEQQALLALPDQAEVERARQALQGVQEQLRRLSAPSIPVSLAATVPQDVAWSARLKAPAFPRSVAAQVAAEVALSQQFSQTPVLPSSVALAVAKDIQTAQQLQAPAIPQSVAGAVASQVALSAHLQGTTSPLPRSVAAQVTQRVIAPERETAAPSPPLAPSPAPAGADAVSALVAATLPKRNPAPLALVLALMAGLTLLAVTNAWPNLAAGALVLRTLLAQVSPLAGVGLALLLLTSIVVTWRPNPAMRQVGAAAFAVSALLTLPALGSLASSGSISFGRDVTVSSAMKGNVIAIGGNIHLLGGARVQGEVVTLLGDVHREQGALVSGRVNALLGHAPGDRNAIETAPLDGISMATAAAFRPVLGWLGSTAWPQVFVTLTGGALLLLFVAGLAPALARRQRHAPMRTLALGVLVLTALIGPALALALAGLLGPALVAVALAVVLIAVGLSVSAYDVGRSVAYRAKLPVPDVVGAMLGLTGVAASLSEPALAFVLALVGGTWGAGTLLLSRQQPALA